MTNAGNQRVGKVLRIPEFQELIFTNRDQNNALTVLVVLIAAFLFCLLSFVSAGSFSSKADWGDPLGMTAVFSLNETSNVIRTQEITYSQSQLAVSHGVPQLDCIVTRARKDHAIVLRESNTGDILFVWEEQTNLFTTRWIVIRSNSAFYLSISHKRRVLSQEADKTYIPSEERTTSETKCPWPTNDL